MKKVLFFLAISLFVLSAKAQTMPRQINFHIIGRDSVNLPFNDEYYLIEDSCAQIIRHAHFDLQTRKFFGKVTDVSKIDPNVIISEGYYSEDGRKNGEFKVFFPNGKLRGKGNFKDDQYDGKWEMYYEDGKPELIFEATNGGCTITDAWKPDGTRIVDKGNGMYVANFEALYWKGRLANGKPDGKWNLFRTDDISNIPIGSEIFKNGQFRDGSVMNNSYNNTSHILLVSPYKLPFVNAEKMFVSQVPCNGAKRKHIIGAQYENGLTSFSGFIKDAIEPYLGTIDLKGINNSIEIAGEVSETGRLINLKNNGFRDDIAQGLIARLRNLPNLHPATIDGKPVRQKFTITFQINEGLYHFSYRFLPITAN